MRVVHVLNELKPSGAETMLRSASRHFARRGVEAVVITTGSNPGCYAPDLREAGYEIVHVPFGRTLNFAIEMLRVLRATHPDVVHVHTERAYWAYIILARLAGVRSTVRTVHHIFGFGGRLRWRKRFERWFARRLLGANFVTNSLSNQRNESVRFGNPALLIPNWYDEARYVPPTSAERVTARAELGIGASTFVVVSLGGNWPYKNYRAIVDALEILQKGGMDDVAYLQIGPDESGEVKRAANQAHMGDKVTACGTVPDPVKYLYAGNAYIMPSIEEGFGIAAVEAMATQLYPILADVRALNDLRSYGVDACWVKPSASELASAMVTCMRRPRRQLVEAVTRNSEIVRANFSTSVGAVDYLSLYRSLTGR